MKAVLLDAPGPPSSLRIGELADPAPLPDEVLVSNPNRGAFCCGSETASLLDFAYIFGLRNGLLS